MSRDRELSRDTLPRGGEHNVHGGKTFLEAICSVYGDSYLSLSLPDEHFHGISGGTCGEHRASCDM